MTEPTQRSLEVFFAVYEALPRQGPGNRACAERALAMCGELVPAPAVLDLGCGVGGQTLHLAALLPNAQISAIDRHAPSIARLRAAAAEQGCAGRVRAVVGDMLDARENQELALGPESLDLVWSEGALYNLGIEPAMGLCRSLLKPGGHVVFTDAVWRTERPSPEVRASFETDYPSMGRVADVLGAIERAGLVCVGHFTLPDEAWWDDFYTPMARRIEALRAELSHDREALVALDQLAGEIALHRDHSDEYAYELFVARRP